MSQTAFYAIIDDLSSKEKKIAAEIKSMDDSFFELNSFYELIDSFLLNMKVELSNYKNTPFQEDVVNCSLDVVLDGFLNCGDVGFHYEFLCDYAKKICDSLGCSFALYGVAAFSASWFVWKGEYKKAERFLFICFQPIISTIRVADIHRDIGKLGGRPEHPLKKETINLARHKWSTMEYASLNIVATAVKHQLDIKYKSSPSLPAIKKWISSENIRPSKSNK